MTFETPQDFDDFIKDIPAHNGITEDKETGELTVTDQAALEALTEKEIAPLLETVKMELANLRRHISNPNVTKHIQSKITSLIDESQGLFSDTETPAFKKILLGIIRNKTKAIYRDLGLDAQDGNGTIN